MEQTSADTFTVSIPCPFGQSVCAAEIEVEYGPHGAWTLKATECPGCLRKFDTAFERAVIRDAAEQVFDQWDARRAA